MRDVNSSVDESRGGRVHDLELEQMAPDHLRAGIRVSVMSIVWTTAASTVAVALGASAGSLVLVAFGLTGLLDAAGSATLVLHFRHALRHEAISERHERRALRVVSIGLVVIGVGTAAESARRLAGHVTADAVPAGLALAIASSLVLGALALRKRIIAARIPSRALLADSWLSATGCLLALVTVAGTGLLDAFGWWWVDPGAAAVVASGAIVAAVVMLRGSG